MTQTFWAFPAITASAPAPARKKTAPRGPDARRTSKGNTKYDHTAMLLERAGGASWEEIAAKHNVPAASPWSPGQNARRRCFDSNAMRRLPPSIVRKIT